MKEIAAEKEEEKQRFLFQRRRRIAWVKAWLEARQAKRQVWAIERK